MRAAAASRYFSLTSVTFGPWLWGARTDLAVFLGSALLALGLVAMRRLLGVGEALPEWGWVVFVLGVDVAHVYATLFRTYFDRHELARHRLRYFATPAAAYLFGVALHFWGPAVFWRVLSYTALFHFVRQQAGWVAVYRARAEQRRTVDKLIDDAAIYAATLYPVLVWHTRLEETRFAWFVAGDFVDWLSGSVWLLPGAKTIWVLALGVFAIRQVQLLSVTGVLHVGRIVVVGTTAAIWYWGIVATNSDFDFTVTNVVVHGVPYAALLWAYARANRSLAPRVLGSQIAAGGVGAFCGILLVLAFAEEMLWNRFVWVDHAWLFGTRAGELSAWGNRLLVPLLAVPQATHYVLDGFLWKRRDTATNRAQRAALGFTPAP